MMRENRNVPTAAAAAAGQDLAERVRAACVRAALDAWEDAGIRGLCGEGRWEYAIAAVRKLDLAPFLAPDSGVAPRGNRTDEWTR